MSSPAAIGRVAGDAARAVRGVRRRHAKPGEQRRLGALLTLSRVCADTGELTDRLHRAARVLVAQPEVLSAQLWLVQADGRGDPVAVAGTDGPRARPLGPSEPLVREALRSGAPVWAFVAGQASSGRTAQADPIAPDEPDGVLAAIPLPPGREAFGAAVVGLRAAGGVSRAVTLAWLSVAAAIIASAIRAREVPSAAPTPGPARARHPRAGAGMPALRPLADVLAGVERDTLVAALTAARGNRAKAARLLATTERILNYKVRKLAIDWRRFKPAR